MDCFRKNTSCLSVSMERIEDFRASMTPVGEFSASASPVGEWSGSARRVEDFKAAITPIGSATCRMWQVCETNLSKPYLEISPNLVWVLAGYAENNVYSNTTWIIN